MLMMSRRLRLHLLSCTAVALTACTHGPSINWSHPSRNTDSRVQQIVIHATEIDFPTSLKVLTRGDVSSHYLIDRDGTIYGLVPENQRAWHAGPSYWEGATPLNPSSIGIEIVSVPLGMPEATEAPFPELQMAAVRRLVADIAKRHAIRPDRIVGHGEVQPSGRTDPGRLFPWHELAEEGLVPMADSEQVAHFRGLFSQQLPDLRWAQEHLAAFGYRIACTGVADPQTRDVLRVFQGRYRQSDTAGVFDVETAALLAALTSPEGRVLRDAHGSYRPFVTDTPIHSRCMPL